MKNRQLFIASITNPKKLAAFRLLPIGTVFKYVFIFITFMTLVSFFRYLIGDIPLFEASSELLEYSKTIGWLIYPIAFVLQLVISTLYIFIRISFFALIGIFFIKLLKRRGEYRHIWRTASISISLPIVVTIIFDFIPSLHSYSTLISSIVHLLYLYTAVKYYPKIQR